MARLSREKLGPLVSAIDRDGFYPTEILGVLGEAGAFSLHLARHTPLGEPSLAAAIEAMTAIGTECMATAFCTWCQDACGWYLESSANSGLRDRLQADIAFGRVLGGTGLSNPMKAFSRIETLRLRGQRVDGGYVVDGALPWVSNLAPGHWFGTVFEVTGSAGATPHRVMAMIPCDQIELRRCAKFIALEGTGTVAVILRKLFVPDSQLLADPLGDIVGRIKPGFILLQTGMGLGVIAGCIRLMHEANRNLGATNAFLPKQVGAFEADLAALTDRILALAATPRETAPGYLKGVLTARLDLSLLTLEAGQSALLHAGAAGYVERSPVNRRLREGYFVALITPSIKHLRQELAALDRN